MLREVAGVVLRRLAGAIPVMLVVSIVVFVVLRLLPADPIGMMLPPNATAEDAAALRAAFGLDQSIARQFVIWLAHAARGDLGVSIHFHVPVTRLIAAALPATIELSAAALLLALAIGLPGGLALYAVRSRQARLAASLFVVTLLSVPSFLWALLLLLLFGVTFPVLPFTGRVSGGVALPGWTGFALVDTLAAGQLGAFADALAHLLLPALALALAFAPLIMRVLRSSLLEAATEDYVMTARLRGVSEARILLRHMLKNAALPTLTLIGVQFGFLFGGTLLVELIYSFPGLGNLMVQAVRDHDLPLLQGVAVVFCIAVLLANTLVDALYVVINPRLRSVR